MDKRVLVLAKWLGALVLLAAAGLLLYRAVLSSKKDTELAFFYDLSEQKLFVASRTNIPPMRGINDAQEDAVRAIVVSDSGDPADKKSQRIAYLEQYASPLRRQFSRERGGAGAATNERGPTIARAAAQSYIFVRRLRETNWHAANTSEAEKIMTEWQTPGPNGQVPAVCVP